MEQIVEDERNSSENTKSASEGNEEEDEEEEEKDEGKIVTATRTRPRRSFGPFQCRLMNRLADTRFTLEIDQTRRGHGGQERGNSGEETATPRSKSDDDDDGNRVGESTTTNAADNTSWSNTTLSDAGSDHLSLRDIDSRPASATAIASTAGLSGAEEDEDYGNSEGESEVDRIRRIHNTIFHSLAHDIAELVRLREETMQFLEHGHTPPPPPATTTLAIAAAPISDESQVAGPTQDASGSLSEEFRGLDENRDEFQENSNSTPRSTRNRASPRSSTSTTTIPVTFSRVDFFLRERLTFHARLARRRTSTFGSESGMGFSSCIARLPRTLEDAPPCTFTMNKYSYTPTAKFHNAPKATPAKPHLDVGVIDCDEKAAAAKKILDKLHYGDPDDENACFVRRFWRETSTVTTPATGSSPFPGLSAQLAGLAERTASLEASLEEVFDGLRMRLEQVRPDCEATQSGDDETGEQQQLLGEEGDDEGVGAAGGRERNETGSESAARARNLHSSDDAEDLGDDPMSYYESWDEETSVLGNPLNYDIWDDLTGEQEAGSTALARINLAERRAEVRNRIRNLSIPCPVRTRTGPSSTSTTSTSTNNRNSVGVGTDDRTISEEDAELDEDSTDDDEVFYFRCCPHSSAARGFMDGLRSNLNQDQGELFHEIGMSEELGRDIMNRFSFSEEETRVPSVATATTTSSGNGTSEGTTMTRSEMPEPLFPRVCRHCGSPQNRFVHDCDHDPYGKVPTSDEEEKDEESSSGVPQISRFDPNDRTHFHFNPCHDDECSTRVYLDEDNLNFPIVRSPANHNDDKEEE